MEPIAANNATAILGGTELDKDRKYRLSRYVQWLDETARRWEQPDFAAYAQALRERGLAESTVRVQLATVRGRYWNLLSDETFEPGKAPELRRRIMNALGELAAINAGARSVNEFRLTEKQLRDLFDQIDVSTPLGLRDLLVVGLPFETGINEVELCALSIAALFMRQVNGVTIQGARGRFIYIQDDWFWTALLTWLEVASLEKGPILRSFTRGQNSLRGGITPRAVQNILRKYPVRDWDNQRYVGILDLRRAYARRSWEAGMAFHEIHEALGHMSIDTTWDYLAFAHDMPLSFVPRNFHSQLTDLMYSPTRRLVTPAGHNKRLPKK